MWSIASLIVNLGVVWIVGIQARRISRLMGREVSIAVAKVVALFLTGIAVMMIRSGIEQMMGS